MIRMVNNRKIMGEHVNNKFQNAVGWTGTIVLVGLTAMLLLNQLLSALKR
jgi:Mn2+/Fe2+ NRAMP family transporter